MLDLDWFFRAKDRRGLYVSDIIQPVRTEGLIRMGNNRDGGYVITRRMLASADFLVSLGVGYEYSFEIDFARLVSKREGDRGCLIHAYDDSVFEDSEIQAMLKRLRTRRLFRHVYAREHEALTINKEFFSGRPAKHIKHKAVARGAAAGESSVEEICQHAIDAAGAGKGLMFKMDVEGAEYAILAELLARPETRIIKGLICEFHSVNQRQEEFTKTVAAIKDRFHLVHLHVNNYAPGDALELSFENKDLGAAAAGPAAQPYPLPGLDYPNNPRGPDFSLLFREEGFFQGRDSAITATADAAPD